MRPNISKFKVYEEPTKDKSWANYADENVLMYSYPNVRHVADLTDPVMEYLSSARPSLVEGKRSPLMNWLKGRGAVREIDSDYISWKLKATGKVKAISVDAPELLQGDFAETPGQQDSLVPLVLDSDAYVIGDILAPNIAKGFQLLVEELPERYGQYYLYWTKNIDRNEHAYFPPELLKGGLKWCKIDSAYGEASSDYGSVQFQGTSWIEFESSMHDGGKQARVTNKAHNLNLRVESIDIEGRKVLKDQIISVIEAQMLFEVEMEKELRCYYGRSSGKNHIDKSSGYHRRIAPGLEEFLEDGNVIPMPIYGGSIDMMMNYVNQVWFDTVPYADRVIVFGTGQGGLQQANDWITAKYNGSQIQSDFNTFVGKQGTTYSKEYEGLVFQTAYFTEIQMFPWGRIRFEHWPILDSRDLNGDLLHPETGLPLASYEYIAMDQGFGDGGGNNIELLKRKDAEAWDYICGTWTPLGPSNRRRGNSTFTATHKGRYYDLVWADTYGMRVKDITKTLWFKPAVTF